MFFTLFCGIRLYIVYFFDVTFEVNEHEYQIIIIIIIIMIYVYMYIYIYIYIYIIIRQMSTLYHSI